MPDCPSLVAFHLVAPALSLAGLYSGRKVETLLTICNEQMTTSGLSGASLALSRGKAYLIAALLTPEGVQSRRSRYLFWAANHRDTALSQGPPEW